MAERICTELPRYADEVPRAEIVRSCRGNLLFKIASLHSGKDHSEYVQPRHTGRMRAEADIPLSAVQSAFRVGFEYFWNRVVEEAASSDGVTDTDLVQAASRVWWIHQQSITAMASEYESTRTAIRLREGRLKKALLSVLFSGSEEVALAERELGNQFGFHIPGSYVVAAFGAGTSTPAADMQSGLDRAGVRSLWVTEGRTQFGLVDLTELDQRDLVRAISRWNGHVGISARFTSFKSVARARTHAYAALIAALRSGSVACEFDGDPLSEMVVAAPDTAKRIARDVLGEVLELPDHDRELLLDTAQTFYDHSGSFAETADALFCHPNTVRYRLRRIEDLTGLQVGNPTHGARILLALKATKYAGVEPGPGATGPPT